METTKGGINRPGDIRINRLCNCRLEHIEVGGGGIGGHRDARVAKS